MTTLLGQEQEAPRYNHPCGDLLDSGSREQYVNICVPLYRASVSGDLEAARVILQGREHMVRYSITEQKETPLHVAAVVRDPEFLRYLVGMMTPEDLKLQNEEGNNAFCVAAIVGNRLMAMIMLQKNRQLLTIRGSGNMMPLHLAVFHKQRDMITYLYDRSQRMASDGWTDDDRMSVFLECIKIHCFDVALRMSNDRDQDEHLWKNEYLWNVLWVLAQKDDVFYKRVPRPLITYRLYKEYVQIKKQNKAATELLRRIWKRIVVKNNKDEIDAILKGPMIKIEEKETYPCRILFLAAKNGNINFLVELIREYPDIIWKTNDDGQTIFHIAVIHRHESILDLLNELGATRDKIAKLVDKNGNTLMHSVSMNMGRNSHRGAAFQLQRKFVWFKEVQALVPPSYIHTKNADGQTPTELFTQNHEDLFPKGEKWIKQISDKCMVVAALIATIAFSAAFTIPGGYNQTSGFPIFLGNKPFLAFAIFDGISFVLSSVAILVFLSLSFSRYSEKDFLYSVTHKISLGLASLTCSIITLMAAFSASFFVLYHNNLLPIIMASLATLPICLFYRLQVPLVEDIQETFTFLRRPKKRLHFNQNQK